MNKKNMKFLRRSSAGMIIIWIVVMVLLYLFMSSATEKSIMKVSNIYMSEISDQIQEKFTSVITLRMVQLDGVYKRTPPDSEDSRETMLEQLGISAEVREFSSLGFLSEDGEIETVYGAAVTRSDTEEAVIYLINSGRIVTQGYNDSGETFLILGTEAEYQMSSGKTSISLIAAIPMEYLSEALFLYADEGGMYFHIIDGDGKFILKNADIADEDYFSRMLAGLEQYRGKTAEESIEELKSKMAARESYSAFLNYYGEEKHIYCSPIYKNFNWYIVAVMPEGILSRSITELDTIRTVAMLIALFIIVLSMMVIFFLYHRMTWQQMQELTASRKDALRANKAKSEFLSSMSHDIRTPMNAIIGMTEIAMKNVQDPVRTEECLKKIKLSSKHLLGLINDVLDMSKIESGKMKLNEHALSLRDVMDDLVNITQPQVKAKNQHFDIFIRDIIAEDVNCDSVRLNQVLINLLSNAVKFTPEEGRIDVYVYQEPSPKGEDYVRTHFRVADTGIGMSKEFQEKIYDTFTREETEYVQQLTGTGLGMSITKSIVDLMGGSIELHSELQKGSEFHVVLDFQKAAVKEADMKLPEWKMLVVDDNEQLCTSAVANLEELGVHADWTMDGSRAVEMIEEHHKRNEDYNFVLVDWKMPKMDGIETIQKIRERVEKKIPVFLVSAYDWSDAEEEVNSSSIEGFIPKPLFKSTLFERLIQYADGYDEEQEQKEEPEADFSGKRILLAEDIDINWEDAYEILSSVGLKLERAVNGKECVEKFESSEIGYYDAILMDIRMPIMNGYEATKAIRELERADTDLPIIAMTADAFSDDVQYCIDCGMNGHLAKPIDMRECMRILQQFLKSDK